MVILNWLVQHGPHFWYAQYLFVGDEIWLDFLCIDGFQLICKAGDVEHYNRIVNEVSRQ